ncbi:MAG: hypothetical protein WCW13_05150 [archaeon]
MLFSNLFTTLIQTITKPYFLIPMIIISLISGGINFSAGWVLERPTIDFVLYYDSLPSDNLLGILVSNYPTELAAMIVIGFIMSIIGFIALTSVARLTNKEKFVDAINDSIKEWKKSLALTVVCIAGLIIFGGAFSLAMSLTPISELLSNLIVLIIAIILFVVLIKITFLIPALIQKDFKKAFQETWKYTDKRFWKSVVLVLFTSIISVAGMIIISQIGAFAPAELEIIFFIIGEAFASTYFVASITNYFYSKQK